MAPSMDFEIIKPSRSFLHPQVFLKKVPCANNHEQNFCSQLIKRAASHQVRLHVLANSQNLQIIGFIAISASELINSPCVTIDYLLITPEYRGVLFRELGNVKASQYLLDYVINLATQVNTDIPFRYLALQPAHEKLLPLYSSLGFEPIDKTGWLFFKINQ